MDYSTHRILEFRRKFFKIFGATIEIVDPATSENAGFIAMKALKLKEDIRIYADSTKQQERFRIQARTIIDFGATYDVFDSASDTLLFSLRRKGLRSAFVRDRWLIFAADGTTQFAELSETSQGLALVRRYVSLVPLVGEIADIALSFITMKYTLYAVVNGATTGTAAQIVHRKNPFIVKFGLDQQNVDQPLDARVGVACVSLLSVIDAGKN